MKEMAALGSVASILHTGQCYVERILHVSAVPALRSTFFWVLDDTTSGTTCNATTS
jgi:hypothetical protein